MKIGIPRKFTITARPREKKCSWYVSSAETGSPEPIEFETTFAGAMGVLMTLQGFQRKYNIPIPPKRPRGAKPTLRLVKKTDDEKP